MKTRRFLCLILVAALLFCQIPGAWADTLPSFDAKYLSALDTSAKEWTQGSELASLFAIICLLDFANATGYELSDFDLSCGAIVGRMNSICVIAIFALKSGKSILIGYTPAIKTANYQTIDVNVGSASTMRTLNTATKSADGVDLTYYISSTELYEMTNKALDSLR